MIEDTYQQYKQDFKHIYLQAKENRYPVIKVSAQNAMAHEALNAGHYDKARKWYNRAKDTLKNAGMSEAGYLDELNIALKA